MTPWTCSWKYEFYGTMLRPPPQILRWCSVYNYIQRFSDKIFKNVNYKNS